MTEITPPQKINNLTVVGINLAIFSVYTALLSIAGDAAGDVLLVIIHFIVCVILAIKENRAVWALSGLMILVIGVATCVSFAGRK